MDQGYKLLITCLFSDTLDLFNILSNFSYIFNKYYFCKPNVTLLKKTVESYLKKKLQHNKTCLNIAQKSCFKIKHFSFHVQSYTYIGEMQPLDQCRPLLGVYFAFLLLVCRCRYLYVQYTVLFNVQLERFLFRHFTKWKYWRILFDLHKQMTAFKCCHPFLINWNVTRTAITLALSNLVSIG